MQEIQLMMADLSKVNKIFILILLNNMNIKSLVTSITTCIRPQILTEANKLIVIKINHKSDMRMDPNL